MKSRKQSRSIKLTKCYKTRLKIYRPKSTQTSHSRTTIKSLRRLNNLDPKERLMLKRLISFNRPKVDWRLLSSNYKVKLVRWIRRVSWMMIRSSLFSRFKLSCNWSKHRCRQRAKTTLLWLINTNRRSTSMINRSRIYKLSWVWSKWSLKWQAQ